MRAHIRHLCRQCFGGASTGPHCIYHCSLSYSNACSPPFPFESQFQTLLGSESLVRVIQIWRNVIVAARFPSLLCRRPLKSLALAPPRARLSLISRHLEQRPLLEINTPFSTERKAGTQDDLEYTPIQRDPPKPASPDNQKVKMSGQAEHPALLIPGPIEFDDAVLLSMGHFRCAR